jgi:AcrR family transcriptional regulator
MTRSANPVTGSSGDDSARMERVLDAAADLLVRWGYRRVTVEDVARYAGVGKGTVYLHVRTKDALFLTVLLRSQRRLFADLADRMVAEPVTALPWRRTRMLHDRLQADDVARVLYLGDAEVLGRLAHEAAGTLGELSRLRNQVVREHFRLLRDARLVTDDLPPDEQIHSWGAVTFGFFLSGGTAGQEVDPFTPTDPARRGELLEHALHALLAGPADPAGAASLAVRVADLYRPLVAHIDDEWIRRVR